jgi:hypothetical protein
MNFYISIAIGIIIGFFIGAHLSDYYSEGFQTTATDGSADPVVNDLTLPTACSTIETLSQNFLNRMQSRPEYTSSDENTRAGVQLLIDRHRAMVQKQKQDLNCQ